jgi:hypothetical protein
MDQLESMRRWIKRWRRTQPAYARMPEELWEAAVALARVDGAYAVARDLGVNYATLKRRVECAAPGRAPSAGAGFVELDAAEVFGAREQTGTVVELAGADGTKLSVRLRGSEPLDVVALAGAFLRRGAS